MLMKGEIIFPVVIIALVVMAIGINAMLSKYPRK